METLDVTQIEPRLKHPTIFQQFDNLKEGDSFVIHNDHDPKPLYYQMIAERGRTFNWEYLSQGPRVWEVKITKLLQGDESPTIGELVAADYRKAEVFRKFGLDFCCGGNKSLKQACEEKGISDEEVQSELGQVEFRNHKLQPDYNRWELDHLADHIVNTHHKYVNQSFPMLHEFSTKVAKVHGDNHPEVIEIAKHYQAVEKELKMHMVKEEAILFPYIKELAEAHRERISVNPAPFGSIANPIQMMEAEHDSAGDHVGAIRKLSNDFDLPEDACSSYRVMYGKLEEFERDLIRHIHLENNILFPKAIKLEKELLS